MVLITTSGTEILTTPSLLSQTKKVLPLKVFVPLIAVIELKIGLPPFMAYRSMLSNTPAPSVTPPSSLGLIKLPFSSFAPLTESCLAVFPATTWLYFSTISDLL